MLIKSGLKPLIGGHAPSQGSFPQFCSSLKRRRRRKKSLLARTLKLQHPPSFLLGQAGVQPAKSAASTPRVTVCLCCSFMCEASPLWTHKLLLVTRKPSITASLYLNRCLSTLQRSGRETAVKRPSLPPNSHTAVNQADTSWVRRGVDPGQSRL